MTVEYDFSSIIPIVPIPGSNHRRVDPCHQQLTGGRAERGQILVIFAGGFLMICLIAALVFDVGQNLLDRRTEQNAADAAALAGARYFPAAGYRITAAAPARPAACRPSPQHATSRRRTDTSMAWRAERFGSTCRRSPRRRRRACRVTSRSRSARPAVVLPGGHGSHAAADGRDGRRDEHHRPRAAVLVAGPRSHGCGANKITGSPGTNVTPTGRSTSTRLAPCPGRAPAERERRADRAAVRRRGTHHANKAAPTTTA